MTNKMTNAQALTIAIEIAKEKGNLEVIKKLEKMLAQVEKKNSADRKPTATQKENVGLKEAILNSLTVGQKVTVTDLMKSVDALADLSNQKVSALVRQLVADGKLTREEIKRKAYFSLVEEA